jgi:hypothetical protein
MRCGVVSVTEKEKKGNGCAFDCQKSKLLFCLRSRQKMLNGTWSEISWLVSNGFY